METIYDMFHSIESAVTDHYLVIMNISPNRITWIGALCLAIYVYFMYFMCKFLFSSINDIVQSLVYLRIGRLAEQMYPVIVICSAMTIVLSGVTDIFPYMYGELPQGLRFGRQINHNLGDWLNADIDYGFNINLDGFNINLDDHDRQHNDTQNVHDTLVSRHISDVVKKLGHPKCDCCVQIMDYLLSSSHHMRQSAINALNHIREINTLHMNSNLTECQILSLVWQRIIDPVNSTQSGQMKEMLLVQLADCYEHGVMVCSTGRITRILQTLEILDAQQIVNMRPLWVIKEEIADWCIKYQNKLKNHTDDKYWQAVNQLNRDHIQSKLANSFYMCLRNNLTRKFKSLYIDNKLLNNQQLDQLTKPYFDEMV